MTRMDIGGLLIPEERGLLLALFRAALDDKVFDSLAEDSRNRCAAGYRALYELSIEEREAELVAWQSEALATYPPGLEHLHSSWILAAIRQEPSALIRPILRGLPPALQSLVDAYFVQEDGVTWASSETSGLDPERSREILRFLLNPLEALLVDPVGPLGKELHTIAFDQLILRIMHHGAVAVGQSLAGASLAVRAKAMAVLGKPWAALVGEKSSENVSVDERAAALAHTRTPMSRAATGTDDRLFYIGLSVVKDALLKEGQKSLFSVAGRLPHSLGCTWLGSLWRGW